MYIGKFPQTILIALLYLQFATESLSKPYSSFIINVCHVRLGHRCLGCYIRESWVLTLHECAWIVTQFRHIRLVAGNPSLDCIGGQYRSPAAIYLHPMTSLAFLRTALVRLDEPFSLERGVSMVSVGKPSRLVRKCTIYKCGRDGKRKLRQLYAVDSKVVHISHCRGLFNYSFFISQRMMSCGKAQEEFTHTEMVRFHGISPVVCNGKLKGYVIAANHTTVGILRMYYDSQWIDTLTGDYPFVRSMSKSISENAINFKLFCILTSIVILCSR